MRNRISKEDKMNKILEYTLIVIKAFFLSVLNISIFMFIFSGFAKDVGGVILVLALSIIFTIIMCTLIILKALKNDNY